MAINLDRFITSLSLYLMDAAYETLVAIPHIV